MSDSQLRPVVQNNVKYPFPKNTIFNSTPGGCFQHLYQEIDSVIENVIEKRKIDVNHVVTLVGTNDISLQKMNSAKHHFTNLIGKIQHRFKNAQVSWLAKNLLL